MVIRLLKIILISILVSSCTIEVDTPEGLGGLFSIEAELERICASAYPQYVTNDIFCDVYEEKKYCDFVKHYQFICAAFLSYNEDFELRWRMNEVSDGGVE